jgi:tRNA modification GTPase
LDGELCNGIARMREGRILRDGAMVVLAGRPNVGKSSLMNALLEENRAIVSATPGTTRDSIEEWLDIRGWPVRLVDTAGLRDTADEIEAEGVRRSEDLIGKADVVLRLEEAAASCEAGGEKHPHEIRVFTKCDLLSQPPPSRSDAVFASAVTGGGLEVLKDAIASELAELSSVGGDTESNHGERALSVFIDAREKVRDALGAMSGVTPDLVLLANEMRGIASLLGSLVGAEYSSDLLENLFSRFCVGK